MFSAIQLRHPGFICYVRHSTAQSVVISSRNVKQQLPPVSRIDGVAEAIGVEAEFLAYVVARACVRMSACSRVVQSTLPLKRHRIWRFLQPISTARQSFILYHFPVYAVQVAILCGRLRLSCRRSRRFTF